MEIVVWTLTGVVLPFGTIYKLVRRRFQQEQFSWEDTVDVLGILGYCIVVATNLCLHFVVLLEHNAANATRTEVAQQSSQYLRLILSAKILFCIGVWLHKFVLLLWYRKIFYPARLGTKACWVVLGFTILTFAIPFTDSLFVCGRVGNQTGDCK